MEIRIVRICGEKKFSIPFIKENPFFSACFSFDDIPSIDFKRAELVILEAAENIKKCFSDIRKLYKGMIVITAESYDMVPALEDKKYDILLYNTPHAIIELHIKNLLTSVYGFFGNMPKIRMLGNTGNIGLLEWNYKTGIIRLNNLGRKMLDLATPVDEKYFAKKILRDDIAPLKNILLNSLRKKELSVQTEIRTYPEDDLIKWLSLSGGLLPEDNLFVGFLYDISHRKRAESILTEHENKFKMIFEIGNDAVFLVNSVSKKIIDCNEAASLLYGKKKSELVGTGFLDLWEDPDFITASIENMQLRVYSELAVRENGDYFHVDATFSYSTGENDETLIVSIRDITERFDSERELIKAKEKAEESDRLKSAFLANMSHEIRTPLNAIVGFSKLLVRRNYPEEKRQVMMNEIQVNSDQLLNIINDILDISKIESNQLDVDIVRISSNTLLSELYEYYSMRVDAIGKNIELEMCPGSVDKNTIVYGDPLRMKQVFSNLLDNALKFTSEGIVKFGYRWDDDGLPVFYVQDTGRGISPDNIAIIFEHFRQEDENFARRYGGAGLGLAISKSLVELMGGRIWVESEKGVGSTFYFSLPVYNIQEEQAKEINERLPDLHKLQNKNILLVDDIENSYYIVSEIFGDYGINITYVDSGEKAVDAVKKNLYHIVLMDINMPGMNGVETMQEIKKIDSSLPVIAQTAYAQTEDKARFMAAGMDGYISKPIDIDGIVNIVMEHIR